MAATSFKIYIVLSYEALMRYGVPNDHVSISKARWANYHTYVCDFKTSVFDLIDSLAELVKAIDKDNLGLSAYNFILQQPGVNGVYLHLIDKWVDGKIHPWKISLELNLQGCLDGEEGYFPLHLKIQQGKGKDKYIHFVGPYGPYGPDYIINYTNANNYLTGLFFRHYPLHPSCVDFMTKRLANDANRAAEVAGGGASGGGAAGGAGSARKARTMRQTPNARKARKARKARNTRTARNARKA